MFQTHWNENNQDTVEITGYSYPVFFSFLRWLYTDHVELPPEGAIGELKMFFWLMVSFFASKLTSFYVCGQETYQYNDLAVSNRKITNRQKNFWFGYVHFSVGPLQVHLCYVHFGCFNETRGPAYCKTNLVQPVNAI